MENVRLSDRNHQLLCVCSVIVAIIAMINVSCSEREIEIVKDPANLVEYDSTYNAAYNLYVVSDDTVAYDLQKFNTPLNAKEKMIGRSLNEQAVRMLSEYNNTSDVNTILSPISASMLYSLMANFTDDKNSSNVFKDNMGLSDAKTEDINSYFRKYLNAGDMTVTKENNKGKNDTGSSLSFERNLWMNDNSSVYNSFLSKTKYYGFGVKGMDMSKGSSLTEINSVINAQMGTDRASVMQSQWERSKPMVTSSMTFNCEWQNKFTVDAAQTNLFTNANGSKTICKLLRATRKGKYQKFENFDMMEIPYKDYKYSMFIILPHSIDGLSKSLSDLNNHGVSKSMEIVSDTTRSYHGEYYITRDTTTSFGTFSVVDTLITDTIFDIRIPKFKLCSSIGLNSKRTGSKSATELLYQTNLPKVSPNGFKLSNVFQSCSFELNENNTTASSNDSLNVISTFTGASINHNFSLIGNGDIIVVGEKVIPKGKRINDTVVVPFHVAYPFAIFIRDNVMGTIPFACSIKTLNI